ncbi:MAG: T9SS type A sorting domain-containing protein, partial [Bacteroidales bacterium]|nr:T9SS type A sorting domain-containing protein [Bacteroidales bacterium]
GRLQLLFQSDYSGTASGWTATWQETSAIEENEIFRDISVYPNPAENILNINFNLQQTQALNISLVSVTGKVVFNEEVGNFVGDFKKTIDLSTFTRGIYFLQLISEQGILNRKIVLQ